MVTLGKTKVNVLLSAASIHERTTLTFDFKSVERKVVLAKYAWLNRH